MISDHVKSAIIALLSVDASATDADICRVTAALERRGCGRVIPLKEAAALTGRHHNTIARMVRANRLDGVRGTGSRYIGVTEDSLMRLGMSPAATKRPD